MMSNYKKYLTEKNISLIIVSIISLVYLSYPGPDEIQPWDEAVYATRAKSIIQHGDWLDQTEHAPGGLHSGVYPPLYIWLTAMNMKIMGDTPLAIRLWSMIFGVATLLLIAYIPNKRRTGLLSATVLALFPYYYFYSHMGQLDLIITFFLVLSIYFYKKYNLKNNMSWIYLIGIVFGLALMSKIVVGFFIPIIFGIYFLTEVLFKKKKVNLALKELSVILITGIIIALPWYIFMYVKHDIAFIENYFGFHLFDRMVYGIEHKEKALGILFYFNQLLVMVSAALVCTFRNNFTIRDNENKLLILFSIIIPLIIFTASVSKLQQYMVIMLPSIALLAGYGMNRVLEEKKVALWLALITLIIAIWSISQDFRNDMKDFIHNFIFSETMIIYSVAFIIISSLVILFRNKNYSKIYVCFILIFLCIQLNLNPRNPFFNSHISLIAGEFKESDFKNLVYIDSKYGATLINPQISYYFDGIDLGWDKSKKFKFINLDSTFSEINETFQANSYVLLAADQLKKNKFLRSLNDKLKNKAISISIDTVYCCYLIK